MHSNPVSRFPLLWLSGALLLGIFCAPGLGLPWPAWSGLALALIVIGAAARRWQRLAWAAFLLAAACLGAARWQAAHPALTRADVGWWAGQGTFRLSGMVDDMPEPDGERLRFRLRVDSLLPLVSGKPAGEALPINGTVQVSVPRGEELRYGDVIQVSGALSGVERSGSGLTVYLSSWSAAKVRRSGQGRPLQAALFALRLRAYHTVNAIFPQPEAALVNGILLGLDGDLPEGLAEAYRVTGTAHIIAISGFNIAVLVQVCAGLLAGLLRRWRALWATMLVVGVYSLLAGGDPPVARAAVMGGLVLLGQALGRRTSGLTSLGFTAALLCFFSPNLSWDISFQLSFAATLGLVLYAGPLQSGFQRFLRAKLPRGWAERLAAPVGEYLLVTLAAQITTLPLMVLHFGRVATWGLLTNLLVLPPQPLVMMLSGAATIAGLIWLPLGKLLGWLFWPLPAYSNTAVELLARLPGGNLDVTTVAPGLLVLVYALLLAATWARRAGKLRSLWKPGAALVLAGLAAMGAATAALSAPDGRLHVTLLPAPDGPTILVNSPAGRSVLISAADADLLAEKIPALLPGLQRGVDGMLLPTTQGRGLSELPGLFERLPLGWLAAGDALWATPGGEKLEKAALDAGLQTAGLPAGAVFDLGDGARLEVLAESESGPALLLTWGRFRALLPGGVSPRVLRERGLQGCTLLVLGAQDAPDWLWVQPLVTWDGSAEQALTLETDGQRLWVYSLR
jgi:competence protein ComEC